MRKSKDLFSDGSENYLRFRPRYPKALLQELLKYVEHKDMAWDCATGNGQVATVLSSYFKKVEATDISIKQLEAAPQKPNITYRQSSAEKAPFAENSFDLITVAQAAHWFHLAKFKQEVMRVGKPNAVVAIWGYGLIETTGPVDGLIKDFYRRKVGNYWNKERRHLDNEYKDISLGLEEIIPSKKYEILCDWNLSQFEGYLNTWSAVGNYKLVHPGEDPVGELVSKMKPLWKNEEVKKMRFPIYLQISRLPKGKN